MSTRFQFSVILSPTSWFLCLHLLSPPLAPLDAPDPLNRLLISPNTENPLLPACSFGGLEAEDPLSLRTGISACPVDVRRKSSARSERKASLGVDVVGEVGEASEGEE